MAHVFRGIIASAAMLLTFAAGAQEAVAPATRNVTPPGVMPGPTVDGPLVREEVAPTPAEPARWRRYFLPVTTDAATFQVNDGKLVIHISGVTPPSVDEACTFADGTTWPCGRTALHQFRMFLRGRAIECFLPPPDGLSEVTAPCRVGETDLGKWLLGQGWARSNDLSTEAYVSSASDARCNRLGIWRGEDPATSCTPEEGSAVLPSPGSAAMPQPTSPVAPDTAITLPEEMIPEPLASPALAVPPTSLPDEAGASARFTDDLFAE